MTEKESFTFGKLFSKNSVALDLKKMGYWIFPYKIEAILEANGCVILTKIARRSVKYVEKCDYEKVQPLRTQPFEKTIA